METVGSPEMRNFRGGLVSHGERGLFVTTGRLTSDALQEALREGATAIDLVDGDNLCDPMRQHGPGATVETVERVRIDEEFFRNI